MSQSIPHRPPPAAATNGQIHRLPPEEVTDELAVTDDEPPPAPPAPRRWFRRRSQVEALRAWQTQQQQLAALDDEDDLTTVRSAGEHYAAAKHARKMRAHAAALDRSHGRAEATRQRRELRARNTRAKRADRDQAWHEAAEAEQQRITSRAALIARWHRTKVLSQRVLLGIILVGVAWGAVNVRQNLAADLPVFDPRSIAGFVVEPLASLMLVITMWARRQSFDGIRIGGHSMPRRITIIGFELAVLALLLGLNAGPHIGGPLPELLVYATPPLMVAAGVLFTPVIAAHYEALIEHASTPADTGRLDGETLAVTDTMNAIERALHHDPASLGTLDSDGLPSISQAAKRLAVRKPIMQRAIDALRRRDSRR